MNTKVVPVGMLPCPFCGETPDIETWHGGKPTKHMVSCINDECSCAPQCTGQTHAEAIARWNTRVASPALQERRQEQRRNKTDNDLAELYARRDKDRRTAAPNAANRIGLEILWAKHKTGNDENARMSKENFLAAMTEAAPLKNENAALRHDNARHVRICAEQATEIVELSSNYKKVYEIALAWFNGDSFALNALIKKGADDE